MAKIPHKNAQNQNLAEIEAADAVFNEVKRHHVVSEVVRFQTAKRHLGTHRAKTRSYVSRSSAKPYPQKGTGRARRGDSRSPLLKGGGVIFGPEPRNYAFDLPKKARKAALRTVLTDKLKHAKITVLDAHGISAVKTKSAQALMQRLGVTQALVVTSGRDDILEKSMRNLPDFKVLQAAGLNVYDVLAFENLVVLKDALPLIEKRLV